MNIYLFDENRVITFNLPYKKIGNFWLTDDNNKNIINIKGENNNWIISGSESSKIISGSNDEMITLKSKNYYVVEKDNKKYPIFCYDATDNTYSTYNFNDNQVIKVGKSQDNDISVSIPYFQNLHFILSIENGYYKIEKMKESIMYLNDEIINNDITYAKNGDVINVYGIKIVLSHNLIFINNPIGRVFVKDVLQKKDLVVNDEVTTEEIINENLYKDDDYFLRSPRLRKIIETFKLNIDSPPQRENMQQTPLIMTLAPMITMAASSMITLANAIQLINDGQKTWKQSLPTLVICISMLLSMLVWPFVTRMYEKHQKKKREEERQDKYKSYLSSKNEELTHEYNTQKRILEENLLSTDVCYDMILNKRRTLWSRKIDQGDFLTVRLGKGEIPFDTEINYRSEDFTMDDDNLKKMLNEVIDTYKTLTDVPIGYSFADNKLTAICGLSQKYIYFVNNMLLQMMAFHSYDNLKIVIFTDKKNEKRWEYLKNSPYTFSDDKYIRFFATNTEEMQEVSNYLEQIFNNRKILSTNGNENERINSYTNFNSYYLVIIDDIDLARKINIVDNILEEKSNLGFSLMVIEERLSKLPSQITKFINVGDKTSVVINSENNDQVRFSDEIKNYNMDLVTNTLANLPLYIDSNIRQLPSTITFLELFSVGQIDQLNVLNRWKDNDPTKSLKAEIGVNENNDLFVLDLHEKAHGPHGLIAGMTGSGKSEFIITYILSMAINYSPEEVSFVLIDYKGGGLSGAFVDSETREKIPHIVGTITNLDKAEINRALSSIQSELRRRQEKFNEVRDKLGESTIDIYKYQKLYRDGMIKEPIPHLIIVSDEFAELKDQQPEFMDDLISTARIGRSLGVHLILATQKPSGVVDSQIWSNSKFKVCLKVQDKADSMEMIKCDLAAELKNVGRFYLQVGYNEYFALGQAAWAGASYYPNKEYKKPVDKNMYFIDNIGTIKKTLNNTFAKKLIKSEGEELTSIVKYLINISKDANLNIRKLWLDRIPNKILVQDLYKKYNFAKERFNINPIIGEYDDPDNQLQGLLTLPITREGNAVIYGTTDSGKDEFLMTFVYSSLMTYDTNEINLYLVDFGAETLMNYNDAPQVGDVILNGDDEKLENLAKMLNSEMNKRKKLFMSYNGNYQDYIKNSGRTLPNIVVVINSIEVLNDTYQDYVDKLVPVVREGSKYGINFVITTNSQNGIKFKVAQACKQILTLQLNNETDYRDILGRTNGLVPSNCLGRGLIKLDRVLEFQTASITESDSSYSTIKELISLLNEKGINKAREIPVMPDIIKLDRFKDKYTDITNIPIGLTKETLVSSLYDFSKSDCNIISSNELENTRKFMLNFLKLVEQNNNTFNKVVIDACNFFDEFNYNINLISSDFDKSVDALKSLDDKIQQTLINNNLNLRSIKNIPNSLVIIIGFDKFLNKLDDSHKEIFRKILNNQKEALKINFVLVDIPSAFKKYEYEEWYKNNISGNDGLWIGNNISQQFVIKTTIQPTSINMIDNEYGVVVKSGMPVVIKLINEIK